MVLPLQLNPYLVCYPISCSITPYALNLATAAPGLGSAPPLGTSSMSLGLGGTMQPPGAGAAAPTLGSNPPVAVPPPSTLRGKSIEEIVNKWASDLESHVRDFNKYAVEVAVWDRALIENGNNVGSFHALWRVT